MKLLLETNQNWSRWCPSHNGVPPPFDLNGYTCQNCKQTVCVNCIYKTDKGFICAKCIKQIKPKKIEALISNSASLNKHQWYFKISIILLIIGAILLILTQFLEISILTPYSFLFFILTVFLIVISMFIVMREEKNKKLINLSKKEIKELDNLMKKTKD